MGKESQDTESTAGMSWDCCSPWNARHKYELVKFRRAVLRQLYEALRVRLSDKANTFTANTSKAKMVDSCWTLMCEMRKICRVSRMPLYINPVFAASNRITAQAMLLPPE